MMIRAELKEQIEDLLRAYCSESSEEPPYLKTMAQQHQLLPLLIDWSGFYALSPAGDVFVVSQEANTIEVERDERVRRIAIFQGAKKYHALTPLVPDRPSNAVDCNHCEGTGQINLPAVQSDLIVCYCGGLGG